MCQSLAVDTFIRLFSRQSFLHQPNWWVPTWIQGLWLGGELGKLGSCFFDVNFLGAWGAVYMFFPHNFGSNLFPLIREGCSNSKHINISSFISSSQLAFPENMTMLGS